eukprot:GHVS01052342.1.p1 GENE.GHVS01052342.1~~GHVS01052342.1.p1  ORF type:complete len:611 (+),score=43.23 GHVS01052342.1:268-2100(+)
MGQISIRQLGDKERSGLMQLVADGALSRRFLCMAMFLLGVVFYIALSVVSGVEPSGVQAEHILSPSGQHPQEMRLERKLGEKDAVKRKHSDESSASTVVNPTASTSALTVDKPTVSTSASTVVKPSASATASTVVDPMTSTVWTPMTFMQWYYRPKRTQQLAVNDSGMDKFKKKPGSENTIFREFHGSSCRLEYSCEPTNQEWKPNAEEEYTIIGNERHVRTRVKGNHGRDTFIDLKCTALVTMDDVVPENLSSTLLEFNHNRMLLIEKIWWLGLPGNMKEKSAKVWVSFDVGGDLISQPYGIYRLTEGFCKFNAVIPVARVYFQPNDRGQKAALEVVLKSPENPLEGCTVDKANRPSFLPVGEVVLWTNVALNNILQFIDKEYPHNQDFRVYSGTLTTHILPEVLGNLYYRGDGFGKYDYWVCFVDQGTVNVCGFLINPKDVISRISVYAPPVPVLIQYMDPEKKLVNVVAHRDGEKLFHATLFADWWTITHEEFKSSVGKFSNRSSGMYFGVKFVGDNKQIVGGALIETTIHNCDIVLNDSKHIFWTLQDDSQNVGLGLMQRLLQGGKKGLEVINSHGYWTDLSEKPDKPQIVSHKFDVYVKVYIWTN